MDCLKEGFKLANRNFHLIFVRIGVTIINFMGLFFFVGVPVIVAIMYLGFDMARAETLLPLIAGDPIAYASRYLGLVLLIGMSFVLYLIFSSMIILYSLGGTLGVLKNAAVNIQYGFSLSSFFREAGRNFPRLLRLVSLLLLIFTALLAAFIAAGGIIAAVIYGFSKADTTLEVFFSSFALMATIIFGAIIFLLWFMLMLFSIIASVIEEKGAMESVKRVFVLLKEKPQALMLFLALFAGIIVINIISIALMVPLNMLFMFAPVSIMLSFVSAVVQNYLVITAWSALIIYYIKATDHPVYTATYEI